MAGEFYLAKERVRLAQHYLRDAHYTYKRWGAVAKAKEMESRYPQLLIGSKRTVLDPAATGTTEKHAYIQVDFTSAIKASQTLSGEIELDKLLDRLMKIVIENAGAERGFLLLEKAGQWRIEAAGTVDSAAENQPAMAALQSISIATDDHLSPAIVNYVARVLEPIVLEDATRQGLFTEEPYVLKHQPKSILCMPILHHGQLSGILYLENNLATEVFTSGRLEVLKMISAQAAISIENARLYTDLTELNQAYEHFVPQQFLALLEKGSIVDVKLGDHVQKEMTILFSDIRDFTRLSEAMSPAESFAFINAFLGKMEPIITQHNGFIDKYLGDGIMVLFPTDADDAVHCSIAMSQGLNEFNEQRIKIGEPPIRMGAGIHTGLLMLGTIGGQNRMDSTVISDAVNLASRLESMNKIYGGTLLISEQTYSLLGDPGKYSIREIDRVKPKGKSETLTVYEVLDAQPKLVRETILQMGDSFERGLALYREEQFDDAEHFFRSILTENEKDLVAALYVERCEYIKRTGTLPEWNENLTLRW